jgi:glycosidase
VDERYKTYNVETEKKDPQSILNYYRRLLEMRHTDRALLDGKYVALNEDDPNVLSYLRSYKGRSVLVVLNMSDAPQRVSLALKGVPGKSGKTLLSSFAAPERMNVSEISVEPFGAWIAELE